MKMEGLISSTFCCCFVMLHEHQRIVSLLTFPGQLYISKDTEFSIICTFRVGFGKYLFTMKMTQIMS